LTASRSVGRGLIRASTLKGRFRACQGLPGSLDGGQVPYTLPGRAPPDGGIGAGAGARRSTVPAATSASGRASCGGSAAGWLHQGFSEDDDAFRDVALELHRELKLQPWHPFVVDVGSIGDPDEECSPPDDPSHLRDWLMVREIRRRLVAARRSDVRFRG